MAASVKTTKNEYAVEAIYEPAGAARIRSRGILQERKWPYTGDAAGA